MMAQSAIKRCGEPAAGGATSHGIPGRGMPLVAMCHSAGPYRSDPYHVAYGCAIWPPARTGRRALPRSYLGDADGPARLWAKAARHRLTRAYRGRADSAAQRSPATPVS